jgi:ribonuclease D
MSKLFGGPKPDFNFIPPDPPENYKEDIDYLRSLLKDDSLNSEVKEEVNASIIYILRRRFKQTIMVRAE